MSCPPRRQRRDKRKRDTIHPSIQKSMHASSIPISVSSFSILPQNSELHPFPPRAALPPSLLPTHRASLHAKEDEGTPLLLLLRNGASARLPFLLYSSKQGHTRRRRFYVRPTRGGGGGPFKQILRKYVHSRARGDI